jgi:hypothetical protein
MIDIIIQIIAGAILGFLIGLTGVGGGVLTVPVLIQIVGLKPITAVGTASLYTVFTKIYAVFRHYLQKTINLKVGIRFLKAALPGVIFASLVIKWTKASLPISQVETLQNIIRYLIIVSITFSLCALLFDYSRFNYNFSNSFSGKTLRFFFIFFIGAIIGATSIGGGILIIPAVLLFFRETSKFVGTSIFVAVLAMVVMSIIYAFIGDSSYSGDVDFKVAAIMAGGSLIGTHFGSVLSKKINPKKLQFGVIGVILLAILMMIFDNFS